MLELLAPAERPSLLASSWSPARRRRQRRYRAAFLAGALCVRGGAPGLEQFAPTQPLRNSTGMLQAEDTLTQFEKQIAELTAQIADLESAMTSAAGQEGEATSGLSRQTNIAFLLKNIPSEDICRKRYVFRRGVDSEVGAPIGSEEDNDDDMPPIVKTREEQVLLVMKLLRSKKDSVSQVRKRVSKGLGVTANGVEFNISVLQEALSIWDAQNGSDHGPEMGTTELTEEEKAAPERTISEPSSSMLDAIYEIVAELSELTLGWVPLERVFEAALALGLNGEMAAMYIGDWCSLGIMSVDDEQDEQPGASVRFIVQPNARIQEK